MTTPGIVETLRWIVSNDARVMNHYGQSLIRAADLIELQGKVLREVEWGSYCEGRRACPDCGGVHPKDPMGIIPPGHDHSCELAKALAATSPPSPSHPPRGP